MTKVAWKKEPDAHDYPAAADYLALLASPERVAAVVAALQAAPLVTKKAKDLLRAAGLPLLAKGNPHVASDLAKVRKGQALSPVLVVRGAMETGVPAQIADGYHRICASYLLDENCEIPCRIVAWDA
ncbi:MAG TPA: hypothetical protein VLS51_02390 [Propionibacteriaceae bacterium]|nr:hypothetical protein [Propionibacteriaceae bacterium]